MPEEATRALSHQYRVRASPEAVFRAISEPGWLTRWLCDRAEITPRAGGEYLLGWNDGPTHRGKVLEFRPGARLALAWGWPGVDLEGTVFSLTVEPTEDSALLRVEHTGFPRSEQWTDLYGGAEWGWTYFAMNLKSVLETGRDLRAPQDG